MRCCVSHTEAGASEPPAARRPLILRGITLVQWAAPIATLALMPKCPACFAAYALLFTGIGLSFGAAAVLRWTLLSLSVGILVVLVVRTIRAHATRSRAHDQTREYASR